ncbi:hypothetical protein QEH52_18635 [Coraliomargarita sp. SDUM461003]|uniref:Uncharacterized protein n=1 Tax=Thalassobacterium maritimum TaxID=3041265 RepID=A0ABU1AZH2_9BACT|nr:hypothetical protein [Coraliomargarita sp. SDUM461003]MBT62000.1 hypothetical protein [Puniceicoccaceae bacterium]MDQ8209549.1 hypothetical protein [Coraliomargarita sp. SDUM461003]
MKAIAATILIMSAFTTASATDWAYPDPMTYEWTIRSATVGKIPKVNFTDSSVRAVIGALSNSMTFPLRVDASQISEEHFNKRITIQETDISWIEVLALVADVIEADILITKGKVILKPNHNQSAK